ncbi:MAG TPA: hypothetical protein VHF22_00695, partial [Planctomycetota bacterium]|nr:hypothetical protein [Planctomycetota bacterium]
MSPGSREAAGANGDARAPTELELGLRTYRVLTTLTASLLVLFGLVRHREDPAPFDPWALRLGVAALFAGFAGLTFAAEAVRRHAAELAYALYFVVTGFLAFLYAINDCSTSYAAGLVLAFVACSAAIGSLRRLAIYHAFTLGFAGVALAVPGGEAADTLLLASGTSVAGLSYVILRERIRVHEEVLALNRRLRVITDHVPAIIWATDARLR